MVSSRCAFGLHVSILISFCCFGQVSLNPYRILKREAEEDKGENARLSSFVGAIAIGDLVKSTLGPKGMDKILISFGRGQMDSKVQVTNDGATILKSIGVDNPAAKILVDMSKVQDDVVGDGTTSVTILGENIFIWLLYRYNPVFAEILSYSISINILMVEYETRNSIILFNNLPMYPLRAL